MPGTDSSLERGERRSARWVADRYEVIEAVASGSMGSVFRVVDHSTGAEVALKRPRLEGEEHVFLRESFEREFQVLAGLDHPRIMRVYDYGVDGQGPYYTMELVAGTDVASAAPLPWRDACLCLRDIATSLGLLHARRFLHRDLSPSNARITPDGRCKLLDFGALTTFGRPSFIVGTPPVVPPEALQDTPLDHRADLFALGALGYFMLTGRHAYPASTLAELQEMWTRAPAPPSSLAPDVPPDLDALILAMLSTNPLARPASAAEVIVRLGVIADLPAEKEGELERLAQSFLSSPRFVGRAEELRSVGLRAAEARAGSGSAVLITSTAGMGRTRLLEEIGMRARIAGATVLTADASVDRQQHGTARALVMRLFDMLPEVASETARRHRRSLSALGTDVVVRLPPNPSAPPPPDGPKVRPVTEGGGGVEDWFAEVSHSHPLVLLVDNVESADAASLGFLAGLAHKASSAPLLVVATERTERQQRESIGLSALSAHCVHMPVSGFDRDETIELVRSIFGDAPHFGRFAQWLHGRTGGCPLHCVEISRQLVARRVIRYVGGMWVLPAERPDAGLPGALEDTLAMRLDLLGEQARGLAECISLVREPPTFRLCRLLIDAEDDRQIHVVLDELARNDVLHLDDDQFRFSSAGLRDTVQVAMDTSRRRQNHGRLGEALASIADPNDLVLRLEAGWHLIRGGDESRGAEMIADVTRHVSGVQKMIANLHPAGEPIEAALKVFKRQRRSKLERMPLLGALAFAGYYEAREWGERYGDEALDVAEDLTGMRLARSLRPFVGGFLSLVIALGVAAIRFRFAPKNERRFSFEQLLIMLFVSVITLTAAATVVLDVERAKHVTEVLEPFSALPERFSPVGIYRFCSALRELGRDEPAAASVTFKLLAGRFVDPRWYKSLEDDYRLLVYSGALFADGACAVMREDGTEALEAAEGLDASGLTLYQMIASQLRYLYYMNRGEVGKAAPHREQVDLYAAHAGSAWQVELWEPAALTPVASQIGDVIELTRLEERLSVLSETIPSLERYHRLAKAARIVFSLDRVSDEQLRAVLETGEEELRSNEARDFIGWGAMHGTIARAYNMNGDHERAEELCHRALAHLTDADRSYPGLFLSLETELASAEAGLGRADEALERIDMLIGRARDIDHPLVHGLLHEARARIAFDVGRKDLYEESLTVMESWLLPTDTPALVTRCKRLAELGGKERGKRWSEPPPAATTSASQVVSGEGTDRDRAAIPPAPGVNSEVETVSLRRKA